MRDFKEGEFTIRSSNGKATIKTGWFNDCFGIRGEEDEEIGDTNYTITHLASGFLCNRGFVSLDAAKVMAEKLLTIPNTDWRNRVFAQDNDAYMAAKNILSPKGSRDFDDMKNLVRKSELLEAKS